MLNAQPPSLNPRLLQAALTGGEISPSLYGRVDIQRYQLALKQCRNFIVRASGGVENRAGFEYIAGWTGIGNNRLIPFVFSTEVSYVFFVGDGYVRVFSNGSAVAPTAPAYDAGITYALDAYATSAGIVYRSLQAANIGNTPASSPTWWVADSGLQFTIPYSAAQIGDVRYTQSADTLYMTHPALPPKVISRVTSNSFAVTTFANKEGPFRDLNPDASVVVAATAVQGTVTISSNSPIFTANAVNSLFYLEPQNLGVLLPWVVGDRSVAVGALRRSDQKTYVATTVPAGGTWHETGQNTPIHDTGRQWDGPGDTRTDGVNTWSVGIEWEYVDSGYGIVLITSVTDAYHAVGTVTKRIPALVVGSVGAPTHTWNLAGDGVTKTFALAAGGYGIYAVTVGGVPVQPDSNYVPPDPAGGGFSWQSGGKEQP